MAQAHLEEWVFSFSRVSVFRVSVFRVSAMGGRCWQSQAKSEKQNSSKS
jgi:hypothetical protein